MKETSTKTSFKGLKHWTSQWNNEFFSDEKKFNLDEYYWHYLTKINELRTKMKLGAGIVMLWAAFSSAGKAQLFYKINSELYTDMLQSELIEFI